MPDSAQFDSLEASCTTYGFHHGEESTSVTTSIGTDKVQLLVPLDAGKTNNAVTGTPSFLFTRYRRRIRLAPPMSRHVCLGTRVSAAFRALNRL